MDQLLSPESTGVYRQVWAEFDPNATGVIGIEKFEEIMFHMGEMNENLGWDSSFRNNQGK